MIDVEVAVTIRRPRRDVAAVMFNPRYDTAWIGGMLQVRPATPGPLRRGMKVALVSRVLGRRVANVREVVDHEPDRRVEMIAPVPFGLRIRYDLEGIPEGTIARIRARGRPTGRLRFVGAAINPLLRWSVVRDLERLKVLLETGAWRRRAARLSSPAEPERAGSGCHVPHASPSPDPSRFVVKGKKKFLCRTTNLRPQEISCYITPSTGRD
ncbi:MAG TPA: SRPBCC family protein [Acetobacteraceae bacterium]|nr:SRPBCC family protein [Acetobacteraceae bacterium]